MSRSQRRARNPVRVGFIGDSKLWREFVEGPNVVEPALVSEVLREVAAVPRPEPIRMSFSDCLKFVRAGKPTPTK